MSQEKRVPLIDWDRLPDIELYMDQVLTILNRQDFPIQSEPELTASMINNYVKAGLLPRTKSKRYGKEHLARLIIIIALKSVLTVTELKNLFDASEKSTQELYEQFRMILKEEEQMPKTFSRQTQDPIEEAVACAVRATLYKQRTRQILEESTRE
jgi:DNA-binding transcriptional MerR regulator